ncbi:hypothetical protein BDW22DRAFT_1353676 [Trametopsis cervina]|nr:hypothetical protein BDW22DRAFT_1353676 [Trametopsis cervina]
MLSRPYRYEGRHEVIAGCAIIIILQTRASRDTAYGHSSCSDSGLSGIIIAQGIDHEYDAVPSVKGRQPVHPAVNVLQLALLVAWLDVPLC